MAKFILSISFCVIAWSQNFGQSQSIDFYITMALQSSPLLKDIQNQVELNHYDSLLIRAAAKPQVNGNSFNNYAPVVKGVGYDNAITNGANISALISVSKQIINKKNLASQFENLQIQNLSLKNNKILNEQDLIRTIIAQYITAYSSLQQLNFNKEVNTLLTKEEGILKKLTQSNVYKQTDYLAFLVTMQQQNLLVKQTAIQYKNDLAYLHYLCGITDTSSTSLQNPNLHFNQIPTISQTPVYKQFEIDSLKLENNKKLIEVNYRPKMTMYADGGFYSSMAYTPYKNFGTSVGFNLTVPIYDGQQKKVLYSKIAVSESTRKNYKTFFQNQFQQQIDQLIQQLRSTDELINDINNQLKFSQKLIDVNGKLLETGEVRITDYILALNNYINVKNLLTQNNTNRLQVINQLNYWNK